MYDRAVRYGVLAVVSACSFSPGIAADADTRPSDTALAPHDAPRLPGCLEAWNHPESLAFTPRRAIPELNTNDVERDASLDASETQIWFTSHRNGGLTYQIWTALRASSADAWGPATLDTQSSGGVADATFRRYQTADASAYVIASNRGGGEGDYDVWMSKRAGGVLSPPSEMHLQVVDNSKAQYDPWLSDDQKDLYYSDVPNGAETIMHASRGDANGDFDDPVEQVDLELGSLTADAELFGSSRFIVFTSLNPTNAGGTDLWYAIANGADHWTTPTQLPGTINTAGNEGDPWVSADGCHLYFAATVAGADYDLFAADVVMP